MKHISILVPAGDSSLSNIEGTLQIFTQVNQLLLRRSQPGMFTISLVGLNKETRLSNGLFSVYPDRFIADERETDLIIIPALFGDINKNLKLNSAFFPWLIAQYKNGAEIACLCHGSFLLAATGLLKGKKAVTHWATVNQFRRLFPDVVLLPDEIITADQGMYCSAGAYSSLNLILFLVEKYCGREIAIVCAKIFEIEIDRNRQSPYMIFEARKDHDDQLIKAIQSYIEKNFASKMSVDDLAARSGLSRRNLERRFRKLTSFSVIEYLQKVRIEAAKSILEKNRVDINEAMYHAGYSDTKAFRSTFKKLTGLSPLEYSNKFSGRQRGY